MKNKGFAKSSDLLADVLSCDSVPKLIDLGEKYLPPQLIIDYAWTDAQTFDYPQEVIEKSQERTKILGGKYGTWLDIVFAEYLFREQILQIAKKHKIRNKNLEQVCFTLIKALIICSPDVIEMDEINPLTLKNYLAESRLQALKNEVKQS